MSRAYRENMVGSLQEVLFEEESGAYYVGHTPNYVKVYAQGENLHNTIHPVEITGLYEDGLMGKWIIDNG